MVGCAPGSATSLRSVRKPAMLHRASAKSCPLTVKLCVAAASERHAAMYVPLCTQAGQKIKTQMGTEASNS